MRAAVQPGRNKEKQRAIQTGRGSARGKEAEWARQQSEMAREMAAAFRCSKFILNICKPHTITHTPAHTHTLSHSAAYTAPHINVSFSSQSWVREPEMWLHNLRVPSRTENYEASEWDRSKGRGEREKESSGDAWDIHRIGSKNL